MNVHSLNRKRKKNKSIVKYSTRCAIMVLVKVGIEICRLFCLAVFACIAPQDFYAEPPKPPYGGGGSESLPPLFGI